MAERPAGAAGAGAHAAARRRRRRRRAGLRAAPPPDARRAAAAQRHVAVAGSGFDALDAPPDDEADDLRRRVLDVELAAGVAGRRPSTGCSPSRSDAAARPAVARVTAALGAADRSRAVDAAAVSRDVADRLDGAGSPAVGMAVRRLAAAAADLGAATLAMQRDTGVPAAPEDAAAEEPATDDGRRSARDPERGPAPACARRPAPPSRSSSPARCDRLSAAWSPRASGSGR